MRRIRHASCRRTALGLTVALSFMLVSLLISPPQASAQQALERYVIRLRSGSVIEHLRQQANAVRLRDTGARAEQRIDVASDAAARYRTQLRDEHLMLRRRIEALPGAVVHAEYDTVFSGLAVALRAEDVDAVRQMSEVAAVYPSVEYHKSLDAALPLVRAPEAWASARIGGESSAGAGIKIGVIDTGIDITHPMLQDPALVAPPGFPKFTAPSANCAAADHNLTNSKVIVARNYVRLLSNADPNCDALDRDGHGTFSASVAAGRRVAAPLAEIAGVAPKAFLGSYKVFGTPEVNDGASLEAVLQALDDAVRDGMQVINVSLGADLGIPPGIDPLAMAAKAAVDAGVVVVVAAGNDGPGSGTISSPGTAPEVITVGAVSNARTLAIPLEIRATVAVSQTLQLVAATVGTAPSPTAKFGPLPLRDTATLDDNATACTALPAGSLTGQVALIERGGCTFQIKIAFAMFAGAAAVVLFNNQLNQAAISFSVGTATQIPAVMIGNAEGRELKQLLSISGAQATASIGFQQQAFPAAANRVASFSSVGPSTDYGVKPDLSAPGTNLYGAEQRNFADGQQFNATGFGISQGTSVSTPLVTGAAAIVRQAAPQLTPAQVKSALMHNASRALVPLADGVQGVLAGGNGVLDLSAALAAPAVVVPSSLNLDASPPGSVLSRSYSLTITNTSAADTFFLTSAGAPGNPVTNQTFSSTSVSLAAGASATVIVSFTAAQLMTGIVEGNIEIRSQASGRVLRVPYWGSFMLPSVNLGGVVNAASFTSNSARLAPGSLISIFGSQMSTTIAAASALPLPTALAGTRVLINGEEAPLLFVSPTQINAQVPYTLSSASLGTLRVSLLGQATTGAPFQIVAAAPGIFTVDQSGSGRAAVLHGATNAPVTDANPARPGEALAVFVNGLGATTPEATAGQGATSTPLQLTRLQPTASIGGSSAPVSFAGLAPGFTGLYQVNLQVPESAPTGELPLVLISGGVLSNIATIPVQR